MGRLKPYDGEFSTINDLNDIVDRKQSITVRLALATPDLLY